MGCWGRFCSSFFSFLLLFFSSSFLPLSSFLLYLGVEEGPLHSCICPWSNPQTKHNKKSKKTQRQKRKKEKETKDKKKKKTKVLIEVQAKKTIQRTKRTERLIKNKPTLGLDGANWGSMGRHFNTRPRESFFFFFFFFFFSFIFFSLS